MKGQARALRPEALRQRMGDCNRDPSAETSGSSVRTLHASVVTRHPSSPDASADGTLVWMVWAMDPVAGSTETNPLSPATAQYILPYHHRILLLRLFIIRLPVYVLYSASHHAAAQQLRHHLVSCACAMHYPPVSSCACAMHAETQSS